MHVAINENQQFADPCAKRFLQATEQNSKFNDDNQLSCQTVMKMNQQNTYFW